MTKCKVHIKNALLQICLFKITKIRRIALLESESQLEYKKECLATNTGDVILNSEKIKDSNIIYSEDTPLSETYNSSRIQTDTESNQYTFGVFHKEFTELSGIKSHMFYP